MDSTPFFVDVGLLAVAFIIQDILSNHIDLSNLWIDLLSFLVIYSVLYILYVIIHKQLKKQN